MGLTNKKKALNIKKKEDDKPFGEGLANELITQFDEFHSMNLKQDYDLEKELLRDELGQFENNNLIGEFDNSAPVFSPSSASKCDRELYFKISKTFDEDEQTFFPYQKRQMRNGSAVHRAVQSDFAYMEKYMPDAKFQMQRTSKGKFAWERNTRKVVQVEHNGVRFNLYGMMDGLLEHNGENIGFDLKTKSTTIASIGNFKLKQPQPSNVQQMVAYSIINPQISKFIILYESLAKDFWTKGEEARDDMRGFLIEVTDEMKQDLLDKLSQVAKDYQEKKVPAPDFEKCMFCTFKSECRKIEDGN